MTFKGVSRRSSQRGYILALNLAVLALMLLGASFVGQRVSDAVNLAGLERQSVDVAYELESARSRLLLMLATTPRYVGGIGSAQTSVNLDGTLYRLGATTFVQMQDMRGLVSLNGTGTGDSGRDRIERLIRTWGVGDVKANVLTDALLDYRDADDLRHLNGAEKNEYRQIGAIDDLRNGDLLTVNELSRVFGWRQTAELWGKDPVTDHVSTQRGSTFNPNTADWRALVAMADIGPDVAKSLVANRKMGAATDLSSLLFGTGVGDPFGPLSFVTPFPGPSLLLTLRSSKMPWGYRFIVTMTPGEKKSPWRIGAVWREPLPLPVVPADDVPKLPEPVDLRDAKSYARIESIF